jgi:8-oxo-dGTP pyrophosphatase MutT (NUDIX family)
MPDHASLPLWAEQATAQKVETLRRLVDDLYGYVLQDARQRLLELLDAHVPADDKEASDVRLIKQMLRRYPNLFSKNCEAGHITGSALVVDLIGGRVLLHYHKSLGRWLQLGGHADYETDPAQIALREAAEESGLPDLAFIPAEESPRPADIDVHAIPQAGTRPEHLHLDFRYLLATAQPDRLRAGVGESDRFLWVDPAGVAGLTLPIDPGLARLIGKVRQRFRAS